MKSKLLFGSIIFLALFSCNQQKPTGREQGIIKYLESEQNINISNDSTYVVVIFETNFCGACHKDLMRFIREQLNSKRNNIVVMQTFKKEVIEEFEKVPNLKFLIDKNYQLEKYGLIYVKSSVFLIKEKRVSYWSFISDDKFTDINKKLAL